MKWTLVIKCNSVKVEIEIDSTTRSELRGAMDTVKTNPKNLRMYITGKEELYGQ